MKHMAYQYEFPLHQGEFPFHWSPSVCLPGVLGCFCWWAVLVVHSVDLSPVEFYDCAFCGLLIP